jgi:hypothetical protein
VVADWEEGNILSLRPFGFAQGFTTAFGRAVCAFGAQFFRGAKAPRLIPKSKDNYTSFRKAGTRTRASEKQGQRQKPPWARFTPALRICKTVRVLLLEQIPTAHDV